ncbi:HPr family phosphocarrier protein [Natrialba asiatica]|uniref:Phosphocarrier protein Hpr n=1 Tax=Natrialba asiatica (strain ATCC 700177 / DSM 12278 / JCM 9576 / FERM P-10747 / NBRC 102637 / 172P1) TaxID=29540 RepID=M0B6C0_NATA1|nr:HPr family phosphocarrier protein [Natrialba asiatica]ELZ06042.1 phosphocarrier protein Hpr [Natrialba asiatica DSM 12278]
MSSELERVVTVVPEAGLHARPAATFVETVTDADSDVQIAHATDDDDDLTPAASMIAVTSLGVEHGEEIRIVADGPDAAATLDALERVLTTPEDELGGENATATDADATTDTNA